jgi:hypothetical protein
MQRMGIFPSEANVYRHLLVYRFERTYTLKDYRCICFTKLKHLIFLNEGSNYQQYMGRPSLSLLLIKAQTCWDTIDRIRPTESIKKTRVLQCCAQLNIFSNPIINTIPGLIPINTTIDSLKLWLILRDHVSYTVVLHRGSPPSPTLPHARDLHGRRRTQASFTSTSTHIDADAAARRRPPPPQCHDRASCCTRLGRYGLWPRWTWACANIGDYKGNNDSRRKASKSEHWNRTQNSACYSL